MPRNFDREVAAEKAANASLRLLLNEILTEAFFQAELFGVLLISDAEKVNREKTQ
jgi:hypothetical protein